MGLVGTLDQNGGSNVMPYSSQKQPPPAGRPGVVEALACDGYAVDCEADGYKPTRKLHTCNSPRRRSLYQASERRGDGHGELTHASSGVTVRMDSERSRVPAMDSTARATLGKLDRRPVVPAEIRKPQARVGELCLL